VKILWEIIGFIKSQKRDRKLHRFGLGKAGKFWTQRVQL